MTKSKLDRNKSCIQHAVDHLANIEIETDAECRELVIRVMAEAFFSILHGNKKDERFGCDVLNEFTHFSSAAKKEANAKVTK